MSFYMATTQIAPDKTAMEIAKLLGNAGATQILTTYDGGEVLGLSFMIERNGSSIPFKLPIKWEPVLKAMSNDSKTPGRLCVKEQAIRVSWRLVLRWIQAQLALVEAGSVQMEEVFLPYATRANGQTVYESFAEQKFKLLESPK